MIVCVGLIWCKNVIVWKILEMRILEVWKIHAKYKNLYELNYKGDYVVKNGHLMKSSCLRSSQSEGTDFD